MRASAALLVCLALLGLPRARAGVVAVFQLSWTSTLQTALPIALGASSPNNSNGTSGLLLLTTYGPGTTPAPAPVSAVSDDALGLMLQANGGAFTSTLNRVLTDGNLASALVVRGAAVQESQTSALVPQSCVVVNHGALRNFVNASTGQCQICAVCAGAYVASMCGGKADAVCVAACADGQYVYTSGIHPPELGGCAPCPAGTRSPRLGVPCAPCPSGTVAPQAGATACTACPAGTRATDGIACLPVRPWPSSPYKKHTARPRTQSVCRPIAV